VVHSGRDELVREIQRLQTLLENVDKRLTSEAASPSDGTEPRRRDDMLRPRVDEAYAQLEIAKRVPEADAWKAIQKATDAVRRFEVGASDAAGASDGGPLVRLTLFASASRPSLRALSALDHAMRRLGDRVSLEVCDVARQPERAEQAGIVFTPVLRIERAGHDPVTLFGALEDRERLLTRLTRAGLPVRTDSAAAAGDGDGDVGLTAAAPTADTD
jgi:hypothetical protein